VESEPRHDPEKRRCMCHAPRQPARSSCVREWSVREEESPRCKRTSPSYDTILHFVTAVSSPSISGPPHNMLVRQKARPEQGRAMWGCDGSSSGESLLYDTSPGCRVKWHRKVTKPRKFARPQDLSDSIAGEASGVYEDYNYPPRVSCQSNYKET